MTTGLDDLAARVAQVDALLESVHGELVAADNPHRRALASLGSHATGAPLRAYDDTAFALWGALLHADPDDVESRHHLAIMFHARAIDREQSDAPDQSNADWEAALDHWAALWHSAPFWDRLADVVAPPEQNASAARRQLLRAPIDALQARLPTLILRMHIDIALDPATPHYRAKHHVGLLLRAPFPAQAKSEVRRAAYELLAAGIPAGVWQTNVLDGALIDAAMKVVQRYLDVDPDCEPALIDALRLQRQQYGTDITQVNALAADDPAGRATLLERMARARTAWRPYFETLRARAETLPAAARRDLSGWYRIGADVLRERDLLADALADYEIAIAVAGDDEEEREHGRYGLVDTLAEQVLRAADARDPAMGDLAERLLARDDLTQWAVRKVAYAFYRLLELDRAESVCRTALDLRTAPARYELVKMEARARELVDELLRFIAGSRASMQDDLDAVGPPALRSIIDARERLNNGDPRGALALLDRAQACCRDTAGGRAMLRNERAVALSTWAATEVNAAQESGIAPVDSVDVYRAAIQRLQEAVRVAPDHEQAAINLRQVRDLLTHALTTQAAAHAKARRYPEAEKYLREALAACNDEHRLPIERELSLVVANRAVVAFNAMGAIPDPPGCARSLAWLDEAIRLDPANRHAIEQRAAIASRCGVVVNLIKS